MKKSAKKSPNFRPLVKKYGLNANKLATMFGYANGNSLRNSSRYKTFLDGIEELISVITDKTPEDS